MLPETISNKDINKLAFPAIIAGISEPLIGLVDTAIIGQLGTAELAGVGIASSFIGLVIWVFAQTKSSISTIVSQYYGKNKLPEIYSLIPQTSIFIAVVGLLFFLGSSLFLDFIFSLYNAEGEILNHAMQYYEIRGIGFPITLITFILFGTFRGIQNTKWAMQISIIGGILNITLDYFLVNGITNFIDPLGVKGAAWASVIAQFAMLLLALIYLIKQTTFNLKLCFDINPNFQKMLTMSSDLFIRTIALNIALLLGVRIATGYGETYIATHTILLNLWLFSAFFLDGYAAAGNAISGKLLGQQAFKPLYLFAVRIIKMNITIGFAMGLLFLLLYPIIGNFFTQDNAVLDLLNTTFWLVIIIQPLNSLAFSMDGILKGLGETKQLRNVLLAATFLGFIPIIYGSKYLDWKLAGIWLAFIVWILFRGVGLWYLFYKKYKISNEKP